MKPQFQHEIVTSFAMWLENHILRKGNAYSNKTNQEFFYQSDDRLDEDYISFACPHKQWVTDSSIGGANLIDSITVDGTTVSRNTSGVRFDFDNGRVLIPSSGVAIGSSSVVATSSSTVKGDYAVKDFNVYITDQTEEELLLESQFDINSRFSQDITEGIKPYDQVVPAIFLSYESSANKPFAFGGHDTTRTNIRCVIFAENSYQLDGLFSILNDSNDLNITNVGFSEHPLNEFGDLKYGDYNYSDLINRYFQYRSIAIIDKVTVSKLNDRVAKKTHPGLFLGFADFELISVRMPRQDYVSPTTTKAPSSTPIPLSPYGLTLTKDCTSPGPYDVNWEFNHNNGTGIVSPHSATKYEVYRQSGLASTGFGAWSVVHTEPASVFTTGAVVNGTDSVTISGADYNYKVSAVNTQGEIFGINPAYSGINFTGC
jgi:hypothetical protein